MGDWNFDSLVYAGFDFPLDGIGHHLRLLDRLIFDDPALKFKSLDETVVHPGIYRSYGSVPPFKHLDSPDAFRNCLYLDIARDMANPHLIRQQKERARQFKSRYNAVTAIYLFWESDRIPNEILALIKAYDFCIVTASFVATELESFGIDTALLRHPYDFSQARPDLAAFSSRPLPLRFGSSAGLWPRKNLTLLVEVFAEEFGSDPNYELSIHTRSDVRHPDHAPEWRRIAPHLARHSNISLLDRSLTRAEYNAWLKSLSVYCFVSSGEGYSVTPREALHFGKPVVLSAAHVHRDLLGLPGVVPVSADDMQPAHPNSEGCTLEIGYDWYVDRTSLAHALHSASDKYEGLAREVALKYDAILALHDVQRIKQDWIGAINQRYDKYSHADRIRPFDSDIFLSDWLLHHSPRQYRIGDSGVKSNTGDIVGNRLYCYASQHAAGHCIYGPDYRILISRTYEVEFHLRFLNIFSSDNALISLDVYDQLSQQIIAFQEVRLTEIPRTTQRLVVGFSGRRDQVLEFRVYWHRNCDIEFSKLVLRPSTDGRHSGFAPALPS